ncbi:hypothetical protein EVAR_101676_1 [Eumeta japonica]|uniref:Uncharacterized protein n=1 Tax=Eumeta variegata TaxID=151549 RepID=A0A4C1TEB0_EUMVA|nr:hypothetical protein EVAR_101676_1 [Eumeta japonica]
MSSAPCWCPTSARVRECALPNSAHLVATAMLCVRPMCSFRLTAPSARRALPGSCLGDLRAYSPQPKPLVFIRLADFCHPFHYSLYKRRLIPDIVHTITSNYLVILPLPGAQSSPLTLLRRGNPEGFKRFFAPLALLPPGLFG